MNRLENEAHLAGALAHEIGHVNAEHAAQHMAKGRLGQMLATGDVDGGRGAMLAAQMANQMLQLKYGRNDEVQADELGLMYMTQAGYRPEGMLGVMKILADASKGDRQPEYLATHPHPETRLQTIKEFLKKNRSELDKGKLTFGRSLEGDDHVGSVVQE